MGIVKREREKKSNKKDGKNVNGWAIKASDYGDEVQGKNMKGMN